MSDSEAKEKTLREWNKILVNTIFPKDVPKLETKLMLVEDAQQENDRWIDAYNKLNETYQQEIQKLKDRLGTEEESNKIKFDAIERYKKKNRVLEGRLKRAKDMIHARLSIVSPKQIIGIIPFLRDVYDVLEGKEGDKTCLNT